MTNKHIVLLGDSIFDNAPYVTPGQAVIHHLQRIIPSDSKATLLATDGDVTADIERQFRQIPQDATHIYISVGGNDALSALSTFDLPVDTVEGALSILHEVRESFRLRYRAMLERVLAVNLPLAVCTIYDAIPGLSIEAQTALSLFNDTISREAAVAQVSVIDLRLVCTEAGDYSTMSPIEPSEQGALKIAMAMAAEIAGQSNLQALVF